MGSGRKVVRSKTFSKAWPKEHGNVSSFIKIPAIFRLNTTQPCPFERQTGKWDLE